HIRLWPWIASAAAVAVIAFAAGVFVRAQPTTLGAPSLALSIVPPARNLRPIGDMRAIPAIAPDGSSVLYNDNDGTSLRFLHSLEPSRLPGNVGINLNGFWSPDSKTVYF